MKNENQMRTVALEKVVLNIGGTGEQLEKGFKLLQRISGKNPVKTLAKKRISDWGVRPMLEIGAKVTLRKDIELLLKRLLAAIENKIRKKQVATNHLAFGIKEYIEIPEMEYQRDIGIAGLDVILVFTRKGKRVALRKLKKNALPKKQSVSREEIMRYMEERFHTQFK